MSSRFLSECGFSIGIEDVFASAPLVQKKELLIYGGRLNCDELITKHRLGLLSGGDLESAIQKELSGVREKAGRACTEQLAERNAALIMSNCGSKVKKKGKKKGGEKKPNVFFFKGKRSQYQSNGCSCWPANSWRCSNW